VVQAVASGFRAVGAHPEFALELPAALIAAGLRDVNAELTSRLIYGGTEESAFYALTLRQIGPRLIGAGLLDPDDADQIGAFAQDPASRWLSLAMVTAWDGAPSAVTRRFAGIMMAAGNVFMISPLTGRCCRPAAALHARRGHPEERSAAP